MESLNMNMSSEIEFLHDQNLQILLRTNSQMWTILIRDLRRQLVQQEAAARRSHRSGVPEIAVRCWHKRKRQPKLPHPIRESLVLVIAACVLLQPASRSESLPAARHRS